MKIESGRPGAEAAGTQRVEQTGVDRPTRGGRPSDTESDSVRLSSDAQLATAAAREASGAPAIRQDRVDAARKALDAGQIGSDPARLAERMISSLLDR